MYTENTDASKHTDGKSPALPRVSRVEKVLDAIVKLTGVEIRFLDAGGRPSTLTPEGALQPTGDVPAVLSASILQMALRNPRPVIHRDPAGGAAVSLPFLMEGRLAGFVDASCFVLNGLSTSQREDIRNRCQVETWDIPEPESNRCKVFDSETFIALVDLLEAAAAELTFLEAMSERGEREGASGDTEPLAWTVWSLINDLAAESASGEVLSEALKARERLESLYNSTQYGMLMLDIDNKIVAANRVFGQLFGTEPEAFIGVSAEWLRGWVVKHAADPDEIASILDELFADPDAVMDDELELVTPRHMILRLFSSPTRNKAGETVGRVFMFRDITEFRQARHELIGSEKMTAISRVAAGLAHGLNNILAGVVTYADFALEEGNPEKIRDALKMSIAAAEKASQLVGKLLVVSGASESQRQDVDLHVELARLLDSIRQEFRADNIRIHRLLEPVPHVNVDPVLMQEAFRHVLDNARQAIGRDGTIAVRTETDWDSGTLSVTITDSGPGIPDDVRDRIFDPFFTTRGVVSGGADTAAAGLGLSITRGIVEQHGGKIYARNALPRGTAMIIELPLAGTRQEAPSAASTF